MFTALVAAALATAAMNPALAPSLVAPPSSLTAPSLKVTIPQSRLAFGQALEIYLSGTTDEHVVLAVVNPDGTIHATQPDVEGLQNNDGTFSLRVDYTPHTTGEGGHGTVLVFSSTESFDMAAVDSMDGSFLHSPYESATQYAADIARRIAPQTSSDDIDITIRHFAVVALSAYDHRYYNPYYDSYHPYGSMDAYESLYGSYDGFGYYGNEYRYGRYGFGGYGYQNPCGYSGNCGLYIPPRVPASPTTPGTQPIIRPRPPAPTPPRLLPLPNTASGQHMDESMKHIEQLQMQQMHQQQAHEERGSAVVRPAPPAPVRMPQMPPRPTPVPMHAEPRAMPAPPPAPHPEPPQPSKGQQPAQARN